MCNILNEMSGSEKYLETYFFKLVKKNQKKVTS